MKNEIIEEFNQITQKMRFFKDKTITSYSLLKSSYNGKTWKIQYDGNTACLKTGNKSISEMAVIKELGKYPELKFFPKILFQDISQLLLLTEWIPGPTYAEFLFSRENTYPILSTLGSLHNKKLVFSFPEKNEHYEHLIARVLAQIRFEDIFTALQQISDRCLSYFNEICLSTITQRHAEEIMAAAMEKLQKRGLISNQNALVIHGDIKPDNVILSKHQIFLIDWESANVTDPIYELAYLIQRFSEANFAIIQERNKILQKYLTFSSLNFPNDIEYQFDTYCLFTAIEFYAKSLGGLYKDAQGVNEGFIQTTEKILLYLLETL
jgi:thiamine kinase-like enzyme